VYTSARSIAPIEHHVEDFIAIRLDFPSENSRGLPALSGPEAEAREIAALLKARALIGRDVTKSAVLDALCHYRRVHIGTHGELHVSAPSFQCLYLSRDRDGDILYAYEILRLDLRGVDLVTLSACETSLGRFDMGDNLRGISANLLVAGASTIIGTLWPVETNTAQFFFCALYSSLHGGSTKGEAFGMAQRATRSRFQKYRDWGAFYLTGAVD
jgi:CHAT domain-containing protein